MAIDISTSDLSDSNLSDTPKKSEVALFEHAQTDEDHASFDTKATKRLLRKMDIRLIPFLALLYLLSFLDRYVLSSTQPRRLEGQLLCTYAYDRSEPTSATPAWLV